MQWMDFILALATLVLGTGWLFTYHAHKRKANGEAMQSESEGWKAMQDLYQQTIEDFKVYSNDMRQERSLLKQENNDMKQENNEMRDKYNKITEEILTLKKQLSIQGRKLEALSPFLCSIIGCKKRSRQNLDIFASNGGDVDIEEEEDDDDDCLN